LIFFFFWFHKSHQKPMVGWAEAGPFTSKGKEVAFSEAAWAAPVFAGIYCACSVTPRAQHATFSIPSNICGLLVRTFPIWGKACFSCQYSVCYISFEVFCRQRGQWGLKIVPKMRPLELLQKAVRTRFHNSPCSKNLCLPYEKVKR